MPSYRLRPWTVVASAAIFACAEGADPGTGGSGGSGGARASTSEASTSSGSTSSTTSNVATSGSTSETVSGSTTASSGGGGSGGGSLCGDGVLDVGEDCDGPPAEDCAGLGYVSGALGCDLSCEFDLSGCDGCNNGVIDTELGEDCDFDSQGDPLVSATCASLGFPMSGANPGCADDCQYDIKICLCGNGMLDVLEDCDGSLFGMNTCQTEGFAGGTLACTPDCGLDTSGCSACGDGNVDPGEQCDDGNTSPGDGCDATCQTEAPPCDPDGTYTIQGGPAAYSCCNGLVSVNVSAFTFVGNGAIINTSPANPVPLTGSATTCPSGSFSNTGSIAGGCTETYFLNGSYVDADTWTGTYQVLFSGPDCSCFGGLLGTPCVNQNFNVTATR